MPDQPMLAWATRVAEVELSTELPRRWAHSRSVAAQAATLASLLGADADLLQAAAVLHDVGYAPRLARTGFHPLDGGRFLRAEHGADDALVRLVANHSCALLEADERGLRTTLEQEFPLLDRPLLVDALIYCDMTTTPTGAVTTVNARLEEILDRYGEDSVVGRFIRRAAPELTEAVVRIDARLATGGSPM